MGAAHKDTAMALNNLAVIHTLEKRFAEAITLFDEVYETRTELLGPDDDLTLQTLTEIADIASRLKQYDRATKLAQTLVERHETILGRDHIDMAGKHNRLAAYAFRAKNYDLAGRSLARAIDITEHHEGPDSPQLLVYLDNLATLFKDLGRYKEAEPLFQRKIDILARKHGKNATKVVNAMILLGRLNRQLARYERAEQIWHDAIALELSRANPKKTTLSAAYSNLGGLYREIGKFTKAADQYDKALAYHLAAPDARRDNLARLHDNIGVLNIDLNRYDIAEMHHKKALAIFEEVLGPQARAVSYALNNLAAVYQYQYRDEEALALQERAVAIYLKTAKPADPQIGVLLDNLAGTYRRIGRLEEAEVQYKKAMNALLLAYGPRHPEVALAMSNLAALYETRDDYEGARKLFHKALVINEHNFGKDHPALSNTWRLLGDNAKSRKDYREAEDHYKEALRISNKAYGTEHTNTGKVVLKLARLYLWQQNYQLALAHYRRAARIEELQLLPKQVNGKEEGHGGRRGIFTGLAITSWHVASDQDLLQKSGASKDDLMEEGLYAAQKGLRTSAGAALAQMSARFAAGSGALASNVRQRQDLTRRYGRLDKKLLTLVGASPKKRDDKAIAQTRTTLTRVSNEIISLDNQLAEDFPEYATLANPQPLNGGEVQNLLKNDEALIYFMTSNEAVYIWVLTDRDFSWHRAPLKRKALRQQVAHLRLALNPQTASTRGFAPTAPVISTGPVKTGFDLAASHQLYKDLLQPFEKLIRNKRHLIIVASDALTGLPFQVLVTDPPPASGRDEGEIYQRAGWLIKRHALTTMPSIASLKALRQFAGKSKSAPKALIGFGDPVFSKAKKTPRLAANTGGFSNFYRGGQVNLAALSQLSQLPDTKDELINVAKTLNVPLSDIKLGLAANETAVKALDGSGELAQHKIVYFATHGLVSGDIKGLGEPALALSLPHKASKLDDGLLTASEVTQLHLNADWVVLSACNTASGDKPGAEALSGLARAFFYAGAKSLLVSHWPVYSDAATLLTTKAFKIIEDGQASKKPVGRAEALRRSMLAVINKKNDGFASHPSYWAPFVVVGEGAVVQ